MSWQHSAFKLEFVMFVIKNSWSRTLRGLPPVGSGGGCTSHGRGWPFHAPRVLLCINSLGNRAKLFSTGAYFFQQLFLSQLFSSCYMRHSYLIVCRQHYLSCAGTHSLATAFLSATSRCSTATLGLLRLQGIGGWGPTHLHAAKCKGPSGANGVKIAFSRAKKWEKVRF